MAPTNQKSCFICGEPDIHRLGVHNCPEVPALINKGLPAFTPEGKLMCPGGVPLPHGVPGGGMAKALKDERAATIVSASSLKGKGWEERDLPPHMAAIVGLQSNGDDVLGGTIYGVSSFSRPAWCEVFPATRSQAKEAKKGNTTDKNAEPIPKAMTTNLPKPQVPSVP
jgi:hypothetical protein